MPSSHPENPSMSCSTTPAAMLRGTIAWLGALAVATAVLAALAAAAARGADADFDDLPLAPESYWNGSDLSGTPEQWSDPWNPPNTMTVYRGGFQSGDVFLENLYNATYPTWSGFALSNTTDTTTPGFVNQYSAITGTGAGPGADNYAVGFSSAGEELGSPPSRLWLTQPDRRFASVKLTNTTYAALSMLNGDQFAKKFGGPTGDDPDWFLLTIRGFDALGAALPDAIEFYLADYRFTDNQQDYIVRDWIEVDLGPLAAARALEFELTSSDVGFWGMNTPAYFALDELRLEPVPPAVLQWSGGAQGAWGEANWYDGTSLVAPEGGEAMRVVSESPARVVVADEFVDEQAAASLDILGAGAAVEIAADGALGVDGVVHVAEGGLLQVDGWLEAGEVHVAGADAGVGAAAPQLTGVGTIQARRVVIGGVLAPGAGFSGAIGGATLPWTGATAPRSGPAHTVPEPPIVWLLIPAALLARVARRLRAGPVAQIEAFGARRFVRGLRRSERRPPAECEVVSAGGASRVDSTNGAAWPSLRTGGYRIMGG